MAVHDSLRTIERSLEEMVVQCGKIPPKKNFLFSNVDDHIIYIGELVSMVKDDLINARPPFHICASEEYDPETGTPTISNPQSDVFYLVPNGSDSDDLYEEWVYINSSWERFGTSGSFDPITGVYTFSEGNVDGAFNVKLPTGANQSVSIHGLKAICFGDENTPAIIDGGSLDDD